MKKKINDKLSTNKGAASKITYYVCTVSKVRQFGDP
jgi:hypothetical protein